MNERLNAILTGSMERGLTYSLPLHVVLSETGTPKVMRATCRIDNDTLTVLAQRVHVLASTACQHIPTALHILCLVPRVRVSLPKLGDKESFQLSVASVMSGERFAVLIAHFEGIALPLADDVKNAHLVACGLAIAPDESVDAAPSGRGRGRKPKDTVAAESNGTASV